MGKSNTQRNQAGLSVIEVVITLFIIGVTLLLYQTTSRSVVLNRSGKYKEVALRIADTKLQTLRTTAYASIPASGSFTDSKMSSLPQGQGTITVTDESSRLKRVSVSVSWKSITGSGRQNVTLETYVSQGGLGQ